jgi:hypothetical protein
VTRSRRLLVALATTLVGIGCSASAPIAPRVVTPASVRLEPDRALEFMLLDGPTPEAELDFACRLGSELSDRGRLLALFQVVRPEAGGFVQKDAVQRQGDTLVILDWASVDARRAARTAGGYARELAASNGVIGISASLAVVPPPDAVPPPSFSYELTFSPDRGYELGSGDPVAPPSQQFVDDVLVPAASDHGRKDLFAAPDVASEGAAYVKGLTDLVEWTSRERFVSFVTEPSSPLGQHLEAREAFVPAATLEILALRYLPSPCPGRPH